MLLEEAELKLNAIDKDSAPIPGRTKVLEVNGLNNN